MTRCELLNNPGSIRHVPGIAWRGQSPFQSDSSFVQFDDPIYGFRAITRILRSYAREGIHTLGEAIDRWAPQNENNSASYVADVCQRCAVDPSAQVDFDTIMPNLLKAITIHEQGTCIYSDEQINQGIALA